MLTKHKVQELINQLPDTFSVDDLVDELLLWQNIEKARLQVKNRENAGDKPVERTLAFAM
ncbi:hypothetical protein [Mucilaginibacter jinjuensis]|uniref:Transposase n=1 Tax=Mucilaginibacter jinjuensis TaxID=1176721 RepID=A0ABY7T8Z1_9SPHI|nr:hypothetical protein [Mucilaginibacter jinjuensis]WCT12703.1 hypothetical protein PQO05_02000 [Mucilaginibacter jinjuensis]